MHLGFGLGNHQMADKPVNFREGDFSTANLLQLELEVEWVN